MAEITRGPTSDDDWASAPTPVVETDGYTAERGRADWIRAATAAGDLNEAGRALATAVVHGARYQQEQGHGAHVVALVAMLQDIRRSLAETEAYLAREIGRDDMAPREGVLGDGRLFAVKKGTVRKAWSHEDWQADVRKQVTSGLPVSLVDPDDGELVNIHDLLAAVQQAHGAGAPRVGVLKRLGLNPDDYAETVPGPWSVKVSAPGANDDDA